MILVLGATGGTGLEVVQQAISRQWKVRALVRSPNRLASLERDIEIQRGDLTSQTDLATALQGIDAVVSAFGPRNPVPHHEEDLLSRFSAALISAMGKTQVRRVVLESTSFLFKDAVLPPAHLVGRMFFADRVRDSIAMEDSFRRSSTDWTFIRPTRLTDGPKTANYRKAVGRLPHFAFSISRADVADAMLTALFDPSTLRVPIGVTS